MPYFSSSDSLKVGIRIAKSELTLIKFDSKKKFISGLFQQSLPHGTIVNGQVANQSVFNQSLIKIVNQSRSRGQKVFLSFPENKTFTDTMAIPEISPGGDLKEAIYWQAQEFLPSDPETMYYDWKKLGSKNDHVSLSKQIKKGDLVVVVSVPKTIIDPIIRACMVAGVIPISCEPISLSLARLCPPNQTSFVAEISKAETTLIIVDQNKVAKLSTIVTDPNQIAPEIKRMSDYYQSKNNQIPAKIYLCGQGATSQWLQFIGNKTKIATVILPLPQLTSPPANINNFSVIVSSIHKLPHPPNSLDTVNLLPSNLESTYQKLEEKSNLSFGYKIALTATVFTAIIMFVGFAMIKVNSGKVQSEIELIQNSAVQGSYADLAKQAETANIQAQVISKLPPRDSLFKILSDLNTAVGSGITISSYTANLPESVLIINGFAVTRDNLLTFKSSLELQDSFNIVTLPLPTLEKKQNINFSIAIDISK